MGAIVVVDALWGDSGKGKVAAFLAKRHQAVACVRAGVGTNAGHSLYLEDGQIIKTSQLPLGGLEGACALWVGSRVAVDPELLFEEMERYAHWGVRERVRIDYRCPIILPEYKASEQADAHLRGTVGSTMSGTGWAQAEFALRRCRQARDIAELQPYIADVAGDLNRACQARQTVIVEGGQGTFLSQALSPDYPFCTSGNCTAVAAADQVGLNWRHISEVVMVIKAAPSRVGNGPLPGEIDAEEQDKRGIAEFGVRTGRRRRKALELPWDLIREATLLNGPTQLALTFCEHIDPEQAQSETPTSKIQALIDRLEDETGVPVTLLDRGKSFGAIGEIARGHLFKFKQWAGRS